jgi:hypothetical protein
MRAKLATVPALFASSAALLWGCAGNSARDAPLPDSTGSTASPIEGGDPVNDVNNPVSSLFPQSTVQLRTTRTLPGGVTRQRRCTGQILSATKILTAAHCQTNSTTVVMLYPTVANAGALPINTPSTIIKAVATNPTAFPPGVTCDDLVPSTFPSQCYTANSSTNPSGPGTHYADMAVLTLASPIPIAPAGPYQRVGIGPRDSFATTQTASTKPPPSWAVGTGDMNWYLHGCDGGVPGVWNTNQAMQWVPVHQLVPSDSNGIIQAEALFFDHGDSGGGLYQFGHTFIGPVLPTTYNLILLGLASYFGPPEPCDPDLDPSTEFASYWTSVEYGDNYDWVIAQGGVASSYVEPFGGSAQGSVATFGASL